MILNPNFSLNRPSLMVLFINDELRLSMTSATPNSLCIFAIIPFGKGLAVSFKDLHIASILSGEA